MAKEILLYSGIYDWTVAMLIEKMETYKSQNIAIRANSGGGSVLSAYGFYAKMLEHGKVKIKVDGIAASAMGLALFYAQEVEALDVSMFMFHRASYDGSDKDLRPEQRQALDKINADLRKQVELKVSNDKFKAVTGKTIDDMFSMEGRLNIWLDATQMKELGIVTKINPLTPAVQKEMAKAVEDWALEIAASVNPPSPPPAPQPPTSKTQDMTIEKLKAEHPAIYNAIFADGKDAGEKAGVQKENDRIMAWMAFAKVDAKKVSEGIKSGKDISQRDMAEFNAAALAPEYLEKMKNESQAEVKTEATEIKTGGDPKAAANKKEIDNFSSEVDALMGIGKKKAA